MSRTEDTHELSEHRRICSVAQLLTCRRQDGTLRLQRHLHLSDSNVSNQRREAWMEQDHLQHHMRYHSYGTLLMKCPAEEQVIPWRSSWSGSFFLWWRLCE